MTQPSESAAPTARSALSGSPAALASTNTMLLLADRWGVVLFWDWPADSGPAFQIHGDAGPLAAVGTDLASSGGWDPTVVRWDGTTHQPRFKVRPFDGRVTALCGQGEDLLVAGADHAPASAATDNDQVVLAPARLLRLDVTGKETEIPLQPAGQVTALACGPDWVLALDRGNSDELPLLYGETVSALPLPEGPATAIAASGDEAIVADAGGLWFFTIADGSRRQLVRFEASSPRVLALLPLGDIVFGATSRGVVRWPDEQLFSRNGGGQPLALAAYQGNLLVLWEDGTLEERDPQNGEVLHEANAPRE